MTLVPSLGMRCTWRGSQLIPSEEPTPSVPPRRRASAPQHSLAGYKTMRIIMEFMRWAVDLNEFPTVEAIVRRFGVSRATAYRWRSCLGETYCLETLPPNEPERSRAHPCARANGRAGG